MLSYLLYATYCLGYSNILTFQEGNVHILIHEAYFVPFNMGIIRSSK
jgi:hypothetical protein